MSDLKDRLARLGLSQYHQVFVAEGFDTWETVLDITESDLCVTFPSRLHANGPLLTAA